jgi:multiple sugar transport system permease protein
LAEDPTAVAGPAASRGPLFASRAGPRLGGGGPRLFLYTLLLLILAVNDLPLLWVVDTSLKPEGEVIAFPPTVLPEAPTLQNYVHLFTTSNFGGFLLHSAEVAAVSTAAVVVLGTFGAYAFVRFPFRLVRWLGDASLLAYMVPSILLLVPIVRIMYALRLDNNLLSLMIIYTTLAVPFVLWTLRSYFHGFALELEQAAMVDGCTRFGAFVRVVVPQAVPGMIAAAIFAFNAAWGEFLFGSTLITDPTSLTLSPGLLLLLPSHGIEQWGMVMGACVVMTLPLIALFIVFQRQLVQTWGQGALRG